MTSAVHAVTIRGNQNLRANGSAEATLSGTISHWHALLMNVRRLNSHSNCRSDFDRQIIRKTSLLSRVENSGRILFLTGELQGLRSNLVHQDTARRDSS